jgi:Flp pilus assembly protein TadG
MLRGRGLNSFLASRRGAVTIEFVLTIPLFLIALAFAFEFGQLFLAHQSTVNNVRSAARYLARTSLNASDFDRADNIIRTGQPTGGSAPEYLADACDTTCATFNNGNKQLSVTVRVNYPLTLFGFISSGSQACDGDTQPCIPFVVQENVQWVGM